jgi:hypothetical protein
VNCRQNEHCEGNPKIDEDRHLKERFRSRAFEVFVRCRRKRVARVAEIGEIRICKFLDFLTLKPFLSYRANFKPAGVYQNKKIFITNLKIFLNFLKLPKKNQQSRLTHLKFVITPNFIKPFHLLTKIFKSRQNWPKFHNNPGLYKTIL